MRATITSLRSATLALAALLAGCASTDKAKDAEELAAKQLALYKDAEVAREDARHSEERGRYDDLIALNATDARAYFRRGNTYVRESLAAGLAPDVVWSLLEKAIVDYDKAIVLQPQLYASAYFARGECHRTLYGLTTGQPDDEKYLRRAMNDYLKAVEINRDHPVANKMLGFVCQHWLDATEMKYKAIHYYKRHLAIVGSDPEVAMSLEKLVRQYGDPDPPKPEAAPGDGKDPKAPADPKDPPKKPADGDKPIRVRPRGESGSGGPAPPDEAPPDDGMPGDGNDDAPPDDEPDGAGSEQGEPEGGGPAPRGR